MTATSYRRTGVLPEVDAAAAFMVALTGCHVWAAVLRLGDGSPGGTVLPVLIVSPATAGLVLTAVALRTAGLRSRRTGLLLAAAALALAAGCVAFPLSQALIDQARDRSTAAAISAGEQASSRCATAAVRSGSSDQAELAAKMNRCVRAGPDAVPAGWSVSCARHAACELVPPRSWDGERRPWLLPHSGFLDRALVAAGRPGWDERRTPVPLESPQAVERPF